MGLQQEIDKTRAEIRSDGYAISVGEWMSIYEKGELDIHPEFQRFFRWSLRQKSRLIESLLLGIPIPQIFVAQRPDGVWDVVDGLQRLSTIFEFAGILMDDQNQKQPGLTLEATTYLASLKGRRWEDSRHPDQSLDSSQRLLIKRAKINVSIILKESDDMAKYELFQRLNTGGSMLSDQEVRNSILVMMNPQLYKWLRDLSRDLNFVTCTALSERAVDEQYDMELVSRFIAFRIMPIAELRSVGDMGEFLTEKAKTIAQDKAFNYKAEETAFKDTFALLAAALEDNAFRRFDKVKQRFMGAFSISAFEALAIGIGYNPKWRSKTPQQWKKKLRPCGPTRILSKIQGQALELPLAYQRSSPMAETPSQHEDSYDRRREPGVIQRPGLAKKRAVNPQTRDREAKTSCLFAKLGCASICPLGRLR